MTNWKSTVDEAKIYGKIDYRAIPFLFKLSESIYKQKQV